MKASETLVKKDRELNSEYESLLKDFDSKKVSDWDFLNKMRDIHVRFLVHLEEVKKYNESDPDLTKVAIIEERTANSKKLVKETIDRLAPQSPEQKRKEEEIRRIVDSQINESVVDIFLSEYNGKRQFGLKLNTGDLEYVGFDEQRIPLNFSDDAFTILKEIVTNNKALLKKWVSGYKENGRDFYFFLYDLPALAKFLSQLPPQFNKLKQLEGGHEELLHNRLIAQLAVQFRQIGCKIDLEVENTKKKVPDLHINDNDSDIKTIVTAGINHPDHYLRFSRSVRNRFSEATEQVFVEKDMIVIAPWSQIMNNILKTYYRGMLTTKITSFEAGKTIFVLEGEKPFEDYYYIVPSDQICEDIRQFAEGGHKRISELSYLGSFRRDGYAITRSGIPRSGFGFHFTVN